ncbi:hypothetical protein HY003_04125 [Candidatus Saccharibacteria bacterium]|nr:hypothetical protein [Candidatus Saccharibacteria bacterium]MBI3338456.1 hypothetical protein [Candidatus Saccharibacteria bacterium]
MWRHTLDLRKTPTSPDRILSATNSFSSLNVATATFPSDKTVFARDNSLWERTILCKSSTATITGNIILFAWKCA